MSETLLSKKVLKSLRHLDPMPVDNPRRPGTPDINYIEGWLELKFLPKWPIRPETIVRLKSWTPKQRIWHFKRTKCGGKSFVLLQVGTDYLLFQGATAAFSLGKTSKEQMLFLAIHVWKQYPGDLCEYLK